MEHATFKRAILYVAGLCFLLPSWALQPRTVVLLPGCICRSIIRLTETTPTKQSMSAPSVPWKFVQTPSLLPASKTAIRDISTWDPLAAPTAGIPCPFYWSRLRLPVSAGFCRALCKITIIVLNIQMSALSRPSMAPLPTIPCCSCWMPILHPSA